MALLRRCTPAGKTKQNREQRQRLGEKRCHGENRAGKAYLGEFYKSSWFKSNPRNKKSLFYQSLSRTLQPSEFVCRSGDSRKLRLKTFPISHDGHNMIDSFRFARNSLLIPSL